MTGARDALVSRAQVHFFSFSYTPLIIFLQISTVRPLPLPPWPQRTGWNDDSGGPGEQQRKQGDDEEVRKNSETTSSREQEDREKQRGAQHVKKGPSDVA
jgi:hypothetical protein